MSTIIERFENLVRVVQSKEPHELDLKTWEQNCGTVACVVGHAMSDPWFNEQGFSRIQFRPDTVADCDAYPGFKDGLSSLHGTVATRVFFNIRLEPFKYLFMEKSYTEKAGTPELKAEILERLTTHINALKLVDSVKAGQHG